MWWSSTFAAVIGRNVPMPTTSSTASTRAPAARQRVEHRRREVQAGGGGGHRARPVGEHRLVALGIVERDGDVGRQRHDAVAVERGQLVGALGDHQVDEAGAVAGPVAADDHREVGPGHELGARADAAARADERLPRTVARPLEQQHLDLAAGGLAQPEPRRQHPGRVHDHDVAGAHEAGQVGHGAVRDAGPSPSSTSSRAASRGRRRPLGDGVRGQVVVEVGEVHGAG